MTDTIREATDHLIVLGHRSGKPPTPLDIQKMLYFVEGVHLALVNTPLFDEDFQAWKFGPVLPSVYRRFKRFGESKITLEVIDTKENGGLSESVVSIINMVYDIFSKFQPHELVGLTHLPDTPWDATRKETGARDGENSEKPISTDKIAEWFKKRWIEAIKSKTDEVTYLPKDEFPEWATA
ncbi:MAG: Panacea domain-containing protein [Tagaea sp.]